MIAKSELATRWRAEAAIMRRWGGEAQADAAEHAAAELDAWEREQALSELTLSEAAEESGLSYSTLQKQVAKGEIPNAGTKHRPRIRRRDLPRKPARPQREGEPDLAGRVLAARRG